MKEYERSDGELAQAIRFGGESTGVEAIGAVIGELTNHGLLARWRPEMPTGVWDESPDGHMYEITEPELLHVSLGEWEDDAEPGDYIVLRDGEWYVMRGGIFEGIYSEVGLPWNTDLREIPAGIHKIQTPAAELLKRDDLCSNCGQPICNYGDDGRVYKSFKHTEGRQKGLIRCWPDDSGRPYGTDASP